MKQAVGHQNWKRHRFIEGSIEEIETCRAACREVDIVLHQAARGSVPRSISEPLGAHAANVTGFVNMLVAAREAQVQRFVYASSSSAYGDHPGLPKVESMTGRPSSPYAATKIANELYADAFTRCYGMQITGTRYFNVFGPRQDPEGPYAAVIPRWIRAILLGRAVEINGDGSTTRDFCFVENAVQANLLAALTESRAAVNQIYNVAVGESTSLNELLEMLRSLFDGSRLAATPVKAVYRAFREGDIRHSSADITRARELLGYEPTHTVMSGLREGLAWYLRRLTSSPAVLSARPQHRASRAETS